ncbi:MAG: 50S ribosomal protein L25 [Treponema sp.]|nr:50S ribosomal protein L25 [Treponema sp.]
MTVNAKIRTTTGKTAAKNLRKVGSIPAVMYNSKGEATMLEVNAVEFNKAWRTVTNTTPVDLSVDGKTSKALIKDVEYNIRNDAVLHADFFVPAADEKLVYTYKVQLVGNAAGVLKGGFLVKRVPEIKVQATIANLPERVIVDVSALNIGDQILVKDLNLGKDVTILTDGESSLVSIAPAR